MWNEQASGESSVTGDFAEQHLSAKIHNPTTETPLTQTLQQVGSIPLTLSDHPVIVELR